MSPQPRTPRNEGVRGSSPRKSLQAGWFLPQRPATAADTRCHEGCTGGFSAGSAQTGAEKARTLRGASHRVPRYYSARPSARTRNAAATRAAWRRDGRPSTTSRTVARRLEARLRARRVPSETSDDLHGQRGRDGVDVDPAGRRVRPSFSVLVMKGSAVESAHRLLKQVRT